MKKIIILISLLFMPIITFAEEIELPKQNVDVDMAGVVFLLNKQPKTDASVQNITIRRSGLVFVGNINGKINVQKEQKKD